MFVLILTLWPRGGSDTDRAGGVGTVGALLA